MNYKNKVMCVALLLAAVAPQVVFAHQPPPPAPGGQPQTVTSQLSGYASAAGTFVTEHPRLVAGVAVGAALTYGAYRWLSNSAAAPAKQDQDSPVNQELGRFMLTYLTEDGPLAERLNEEIAKLGEAPHNALDNDEFKSLLTTPDQKNKFLAFLRAYTKTILVNALAELFGQQASYFEKRYAMSPAGLTAMMRDPRLNEIQRDALAELAGWLGAQIDAENKFAAAIARR